MGILGKFAKVKKDTNQDADDDKPKGPNVMKILKKAPFVKPEDVPTIKTFKIAPNICEHGKSPKPYRGGFHIELEALAKAEDTARSVGVDSVRRGIFKLRP